MEFGGVEVVEKTEGAKGYVNDDIISKEAIKSVKLVHLKPFPRKAMDLSLFG